MSLLQHVLVPHHALIPPTADLNVEQWAEGVIYVQPPMHCTQTLILSAGIHGNETAPIELLDRLYQQIMTGQLTLNVAVLFILGHPEAIRRGLRYRDHDLNRLFGHNIMQQGEESQRAQQLQHCLQQLYVKHGNTQLFHYDLHTAIRTSLLPRFALLPAQDRPYSAQLLNSLAHAQLDAVVYHRHDGHTFSAYSSQNLHAHSVTLELGQAKPLGQNDLTQFAAIEQTLADLLEQRPLPQCTAGYREFDVVDEILKQDADFILHVADDAANFSTFAQGQLIASQRSQCYTAHSSPSYLLFPNPHVATGLRAGLILAERGV